MVALATMCVAEVPSGSFISQRSLHRVFWRRCSGRVRLQGGGDIEGWRARKRQIPPRVGLWELQSWKVTAGAQNQIAVSVNSEYKK